MMSHSGSTLRGTGTYQTSVDQIVFATDYAYTGEIGVLGVVKAIEKMNITGEEKAMIFSKNARRLLHVA